MIEERDEEIAYLRKTIDAMQKYIDEQFEKIPEGCTVSDAKVLRQANHSLSDTLTIAKTNHLFTLKSIEEKLGLVI